MRVRWVRRAGLYGVLPLVVLAVAAFGWYRFSDTGRDHRYRARLADFCQGLIPEAESAVLTGHDEGGLGHDFHDGGPGEPVLDDCEVAGLRLAIGDVADRFTNTGGGAGVMTLLGPAGSDHLPVPLGGGWRGYTDLDSTGVVLPCGNRHSTVVVSATSDGSHTTGQARARQVARLVTATAVRAAERRHCEAKPGGEVPRVPGPAGEMPPESATGTCRGIPVQPVVDTGEVGWLKETDAGGTAPVERCELGRTVAFSSVAYSFEADYGVYAQRLRSRPDEEGDFGPPAGRERARAWATARCPGHTARALFLVDATEYADPKAGYLTSALRAFAERAAERHGCTGLRLPR
ncbi:hypothetical protein [Streptomyces sp. NPDC050560]|uniref:hypothetical protein n=1 Tax=Streptomyces sp. NPDC050560 TaxID=3365630 RepID=UPI00379E74F6